MREEMKHQLIKDIVTAGIAWLVVGLVFSVLAGAGFFGGFFIGFFCAGLPFGWRWISGVFTAFSLYAVLIKALLAMLLGWIALPVVIVKDIINYATAE